MLGRWRRWRNRLTSEVLTSGPHRARVTRQRGKIVGVELWLPANDDGAYGYVVFKGPIRT